MQDNDKVKAVLDRLNQEEDGEQVWVEVDGAHMVYAATTTTKGANFDIDFSKGMVVKYFLNTQTAELKSYFFRELSQ